MPAVSCLECQKNFYAKPRHIQKGWGKFCSKKCKNLSQKTGKTVSCFSCNQHIYRNLKDLRSSSSDKYFCSKACQTIWRNAQYVGNRHGSSKGGESSYKQIWQRAKVAPLCAKCKTRYMRILAIHHKDRNRKNNKVSNLVWLCHNCYFLVHHYKNEAGKFLVPVA